MSHLQVGIVVIMAWLGGFLQGVWPRTFSWGLVLALILVSAALILGQGWAA